MHSSKTHSLNDNSRVSNNRNHVYTRLSAGVVPVSVVCHRHLNGVPKRTNVFSTLSITSPYVSLANCFPSPKSFRGFPRTRSLLLCRLGRPLGSFFDCYILWSFPTNAFDSALIFGLWELLLDLNHLFLVHTCILIVFFSPVYLL